MEAKEWEIWVKVGTDKSIPIKMLNTTTVGAFFIALTTSTSFKKLSSCDPGELVVRTPEAPLPGGTDTNSVTPAKFKQVLDNTKATLSTVLKPTIAGRGEYDVYVEPPAKSKATAITSLEARFLQLEVAEAVNREPALGLFDNMSSCDSKHFSPEDKQKMKPQLGTYCYICHAPNPSIAHILPGNPVDVVKRKDKVQCFNAVNKPRFKTDYQFHDVRNAFLLCGAKDDVGSCHWAYDHHLVAITYNPFSQKYNLFWFANECLNSNQTDKAELTTPKDFNPQKRGFAFHALETLKRRQFDETCSLAQHTQLYQDAMSCARLSMDLEENKGNDSGTQTEAQGAVQAGSSSDIDLEANMDDLNIDQSDLSERVSLSWQSKPLFWPQERSNKPKMQLTSAQKRRIRKKQLEKKQVLP